jgi:hypothetical protein
MCVYASDFITRPIAFIPDTRFSRPPRAHGEREGARRSETEREREREGGEGGGEEIPFT